MEILNELREMVARSGESLSELARRSGVDKATLSRLGNGGGLSLPNAERLAPALGYELKLTRRKAAK